MVLDSCSSIRSYLYPVDDITGLSIMTGTIFANARPLLAITHDAHLLVDCLQFSNYQGQYNTILVTNLGDSCRIMPCIFMLDILVFRSNGNGSLYGLSIWLHHNGSTIHQIIVCFINIRRIRVQIYHPTDDLHQLCIK